MKRRMPWSDQVDVISPDDSSSSDADKDVDCGVDVLEINMDAENDLPAKDISPEALLNRRAAMYQEYMKHITIPTQRGSVIPFSSWVGLGRSLKQLYGQPLHYLTNILLKQWDQLRIGSADEDLPVDVTIHPQKAEATIWLVEEVHRRTSSHHHIAKLWASDPLYHAFVDPVFPQI